MDLFAWDMWAPVRAPPANARSHAGIYSAPSGSSFTAGQADGLGFRPAQQHIATAGYRSSTPKRFDVTHIPSAPAYRPSQPAHPPLEGGLSRPKHDMFRNPPSVVQSSPNLHRNPQLLHDGLRESPEKPTLADLSQESTTSPSVHELSPDVTTSPSASEKLFGCDQSDDDSLVPKSSSDEGSVCSSEAESALPQSSWQSPEAARIEPCSPRQLPFSKMLQTSISSQPTTCPSPSTNQLPTPRKDEEIEGRSAFASLEIRDEDHHVKKARAQVRAARGLNGCLDSELRSLDEEMAELTKDLLTLKQQMSEHPRPL